jgi:hypothetical protein
MSRKFSINTSMRIQLSSAAHKQAPEYTLMYTYDIRRLPRSLHLMIGLWIILEKREMRLFPQAKSK